MQEKLHCLSTRDNNRKVKSGFENMIKYFRNYCAGSFFIIQILEIFPDTGYKNTKVCPIERVRKLKKRELLDKDTKDHLSLRPK